MLLSRIRTLLKQSSIYSVSWLATSLTGVLLLPVYTAYMTPADYGIVQILEYTARVLLIAVVAGQVPAIYRFYNERESDAERRQVVATGFTYVAGVSALALLAIYPFNGPLSGLLLGEGADPVFLRLAIAVLFCDILILVPTAYFTVAQRPLTYVAYSLGRLAVGVAANLVFIVGMKLGALGMLLGNLTSSLTFAVVMSAHMIARNGLPGRRDLLMPMLRFGLPMVPALMASALMQNADRYFLRAFAGLDQVGIYSLGYKFPFFLASLVISSFGMVWSSHMLYSIAKDPAAKWQFARIATYFFTGFTFLMYCLALSASTVIHVMADAAYWEAIQVIPVVCLGMCFYALHSFATVGAYITKRTLRVPASYLVALAVNLGLNYLVVPVYGYLGAAWVAAATYLVFCVVGYLVCNPIYPIAFEFRRLGHVLALALGLYALFHLVPAMPGAWDLVRQSGFALLFPVALFATGFLNRNEVAVANALMTRSPLPPGVDTPVDVGAARTDEGA
ncbi:MAG: oligosaccharide flippase family protein [Nitrospirae bacterium]|nr:oligosaccharide flippase family protein [Nitrospirota bacterium]